MQEGASPAFLEPQWFFPLFVLLWLFISSFLSLAGGWFSLSTHFRAPQSSSGQRFKFASGSMGVGWFPVNYNGCLFVTVNELGFGLSILFLFRFCTPPLFIPWSAITSVETKRFVFVRRTVIRLREYWPSISIRGAAGERIAQAYSAANVFSAT